MSVFAVQYKVKNPETGKKVTKTKWRVQIRTKEINVSKLFDTEDDAKEFEKKSFENPAMEIINKLVEENESIDMRQLLKIHYNETLSKLSKSSTVNNKNRCLSSVPDFKIPYKFLAKRIDFYKFNKTIVKSMLGHNFDYQKDGIPVGDFFIETIDFHWMIAYVEARKEHGLKDNTILRELSIFSGAWERLYRYYSKQFPNGLTNPVKAMPKGEKPKPYLGRKRVLTDEEALNIAQWLKMKTNQQPFYVFVQCLYSGARKSEVLGILWENIDFERNSIFLPKTKNGQSRDIDLEESFKEWLLNNKKESGVVFTLTNWNFRQYWVDALKALDMYDVSDRLHFHDTRRTAISKNIKNMGASSFQLAKVFGTTPKAIQEAKTQADDLHTIFQKLRSGEKLTEHEIMRLAGHSDINTTQIYNADRN